jgi:hypothetical protein
MLNILKTLFLTAAFVFASSSQAVAIDQTIENRYVVGANGAVVGTMDIRRSSRGASYEELQLETQLHLNIGSVDDIREVTMDSNLRFGPDGIIRFDHRLKESDLRYRVAGERVPEGVWVSAQRVRTPTQHEDKNFIDAALQLASNVVPHLGIAVSLLASEGDTSEPIPLDEFDLTESELPQFIANDRTGRLRVLNTEELDINTIDLRQEGRETLLVGDERLEVRVASVIGKDSRAQYWVATDSLGPFVVKMERQDKQGTYTVRLSQHPIMPST